ncbi:MAG: hypothetical protein KGI38_12165 [Thaumarchaeota archaeon]|nr:hypothetical protein [Nitrososphaerota archaeon]
MVAATVAAVVFALVVKADAEVTKLGKRRVEDGFLHAGRVHEQAGEEGLVQGSSDLLVVADVQPVAVLQQS